MDMKLKQKKKLVSADTYQQHIPKPLRHRSSTQPLALSRTLGTARFLRMQFTRGTGTSTNSISLSLSLFLSHRQKGRVKEEVTGNEEVSLVVTYIYFFSHHFI